MWFVKKGGERMLSWTFSKYLHNRYLNLLNFQERPFEAQNIAFLNLKKRLKGQLIYDDYVDFIRHQSRTTYESLNDAFLKEELAKDHKKKYEFIGLSSGTTGHNSKEVPFTSSMVQMFQNYQLTVASIIEASTSLRILRDQRITLGSIAVYDHNQFGVPRGYISGYLSMKSPVYTRHLAFPSVKINLMRDFDQKTKQLIKETSTQNIRYIGGVPTYLINLFESMKEELNINTINEIWPQFKLIIYSGTPIAPYKEKLNQLVGHELKYLGVYTATEGPYGFEIPDLNKGQEGHYFLNLHDVVFAFRDLTNNQVFGIHELIQGNEYEVLISMPNGFLNYSTGDMVRIRSVYPYVSFELLGRVGQGINVATEKMSMNQLTAAFSKTKNQLRCDLEHFFVYPSSSESGRPCYEWILVTDDEVKIDNVGETLDQFLCEVNPDYFENRRDLKLLDKPKVSILPRRFIQTYFRSKCEKGQLKMKSAFPNQDEFFRFKSEIENLGGWQ